MVYFNVKYTTISTWGRTKSFLCCSQVFWPEGRFWDFFGLKKAVRPSEGQKNPKNGPKAKKFWPKHKTTFSVIPNGDKWSVLNVECHFFTYRKSFPFEKVSFVMEKIATGWKDFLFWFARNEKNRAQTKTCPIRKNTSLLWVWAFLDLLLLGFLSAHIYFFWMKTSLHKNGKTGFHSKEVHVDWEKAQSQQIKKSPNSQ